MKIITKIILCLLFCTASVFAAKQNYSKLSIFNRQLLNTNNLSPSQNSSIIVNQRLQSREFVDGEIIVKFKSAPSGKRTKAQRLKIKKKIRQKAKANLKKEIKFVGLEVWNLDNPNVNVLTEIEKLNKNDEIEYAEPNYIIHALKTPNDPGFEQLWGLHNIGQDNGTPDADINAVEAWTVSTGGDVVIAVIDTGIDYEHSDLAANMWRNPGEIPENGIDDDNNGYIDDIYGIDTYNNDSDPMDDQYHGTHCAGTIAAVGNNGVGVVGVCWKAKLMALKFLSSGGSGSIDNAIECIEYAVNNGAKIMNNSWGGGGFSQALEEAIEISNQSNVLFCAAAGNSSNNNDNNAFFPSSYANSNIISIAASDNNDNLASFSCYGFSSVDFAAPGVDIFSTGTENTYKVLSGTSMAAPHCSGAAGLLLSINPNLTVVEIKKILMDNVDEKPAFANKVASNGRLNIFKAIKNTVGVHFDKNQYFVHEWASIKLVDMGLVNTISNNVQITTINGDSEIITLIENEAGGFLFTNKIFITDGTPIANNNYLEVIDGSQIYVTYYSDSHGMMLTGTAIINHQLDVTITNDVNNIANEIKKVQLGGFNNGNVLVDMVVSNAANGEWHKFVTTNYWITPEISVTDGYNVITVSGKNIHDYDDVESFIIIREGPFGITNFVSLTGKHQWPFISWSTASTNIQAAIDAAGLRNTVLVSNGIYKEAEIFINKKVTLCSLGEDSENTIIDGENVRRCISVTANATIKGFSITRGFVMGYYNGGGIFMSGGLLVDCRIYDNYCWAWGGGIGCYDGGTVSNCLIYGNKGSFGGGIKIRDSLIANCIISNNINTIAFGGGIAAVRSKIENCIVVGNKAFESGGGIDIDGGEINNCIIKANTGNEGGGVNVFFNCLVNNCIISENVGNLGGGFYGFGGTINNCLITKNYAAVGGGLQFSTEYMYMNNCTVINNSAQKFAGGIRCRTGGDLRNSIVYHNIAPEHPNFENMGYNDYPDRFSYKNCCIFPDFEDGEENIISDPKLAGIANPHLLPESPCINAGNNEFATGYDLDGEIRINDTVEIGCDEYFDNNIVGNLDVGIIASITNLTINSSCEFISNIKGKALRIVWNIGENESNAMKIVHSWAEPGNYPVILTAFNSDYIQGISATVMVQVVASANNYVSPTGLSVPPYSTWATAATNIQDAINACEFNDGIVLVTDGVYRTYGYVSDFSFPQSNCIGITKSIKVQSVNGPKSTIIAAIIADSSFARVRCAYLSDGILSGFTLSNSYHGKGGAVYLNNGGTLSNCVITCSKANFREGVVHCENNGLVRNCLIVGNYSQGIRCYYGGTVKNCTIANNPVGGIVFYQGGEILNSIITNNSGRGVVCTYAGKVENCLIAKNSDSSGGGIYLINSKDLVKNCTISDNTATEKGGGVYCSSEGRVQNSIIFFNSAPEGSNYYGGTRDYCCTTPLDGIGSIDAEPKFIEGSYKIQKTSPCINSGNNDYVTTDWDLDGNPRIIGTKVDIGCYENLPEPSFFVVFSFLFLALCKNEWVSGG